MRQNADLAEQILLRWSVPALPLDRLVEAVQGRTGAPAGGCEVLLQEILSRPDHFRVLDPWVGPWRTLVSRGEVPPAAPWIIARKLPNPQAGASFRSLDALSQSLRAIGLELDAGCTASVARWLRLVEEAREIHPRLQADAVNQPDRHSSSASTEMTENPLPAAAA